MKRFFVQILVFCLLICLFAEDADPPASAYPPCERTETKESEGVPGGVYALLSETRESVRSGTAVAVRDEQDAVAWITCRHVTRDAERITLLIGEEAYPVSVAAEADTCDLSFLTGDVPDVPALSLSVCRAEWGEGVTTVGNERGEGLLVRHGRVSLPYTDADRAGVFYHRLSVSCDRGASGGAVIGESGQLLGMICFLETGADGTSATYALTAEGIRGEWEKCLPGIVCGKSG